jgi:NADPH:quinone reductase-like Zn-dependent oxidoreductase
MSPSFVLTNFCCRYVSKQPLALSAQHAAGLPLCSLTSYHALKTYASIQHGQTVVIIGASSGTGLMGVQLAKALGAARVIAVCSGRNAERVLQVGADEVIDYSKESWWQNASLCLNKADIVCAALRSMLSSDLASFVSVCIHHLALQVRLRGRQGNLGQQPLCSKTLGQICDNCWR